MRKIAQAAASILVFSNAILAEVLRRTNTTEKRVS